MATAHQNAILATGLAADGAAIPCRHPRDLVLMLDKVSNPDPDVLASYTDASWVGDASISWRREIRHRNVVHASGGQVHSHTAPSPLAVPVPPGHQRQACQSPTGHTRWPDTPMERLSAGPHDFLSCRVASQPRPCHQPTWLIQREPREIPLDRTYAHLQVPKGNPRHRAHTQ